MATRHRTPSQYDKLTVLTREEATALEAMGLDVYFYFRLTNWPRGNFPIIHYLLNSPEEK